MPRKQDPDEDEDDLLDSGSEVASPEVKPTKKRKSEPKAESSKKAKTTAKKSGSDEAEPNPDIGTKQTTAEGRPCVNLSDYRRVTINEFKGAMLIDIRETYKDKASGDMKPGKKGISLNLEQWRVFKSSIELIDEMLGEEKDS